MYSYPVFLFFQNDNDVMEQEIDILTLNRQGQESVSPCDFELLKVLGQGSFGKVSSSQTSIL